MPESARPDFSPAVPVLRVADVDASLAYYQDALGFKLRWRWSSSFACVVRGHCQLFLTDDRQSQPRMWVWIGVEDVRALHAACCATAARVRNPPSNFEWGLEMQVEDLDGNVLRLGSDREEGAPLGVWKDADGVSWRHLGNGQAERVG